jgi:hypothetical protein
MTRRLLFLLPLAACVRADSERDARDLISAAAGALSAGKVALFLDFFDAKMAGFDTLRDSVTGLTSQAEVGCNVEIVTNEGDDTERTLTLDWILTLDRKDDGPGTTRREKTVTCRLKKTGKTWRIIAFDPLDLFASPGA